MNEATVFESRLSKLEQDNQRLRLTVGALLLVLAAVPLVGAMMPEQIPDLIQARAFRVIGENGPIRAQMDDSGIDYYDGNGDMRASISTDGTSYRDKNGDLRASMNASGILYYDNNLRAVMNAYGILYLDENGDVIWRTPEH